MEEQQRLKFAKEHIEYRIIGDLSMVVVAFNNNSKDYFINFEIKNTGRHLLSLSLRKREDNELMFKTNIGLSTGDIRGEIVNVLAHIINYIEVAEND